MRLKTLKNPICFEVQSKEDNINLDDIISLNRWKFNEKFIIEIKKEFRNLQIAQFIGSISQSV